ncbi:glycohydrolase toxin TNT-related protein [Microcystis aeruginosa]
MVTWFDEQGGGTQYELPKKIKELIEDGSIRVIEE